MYVCVCVCVCVCLCVCARAHARVYDTCRHTHMRVFVRSCMRAHVRVCALTCCSVVDVDTRVHMHAGVDKSHRYDTHVCRVRVGRGTDRCHVCLLHVRTRVHASSCTFPRRNESNHSGCLTALLGVPALDPMSRHTSKHAHARAIKPRTTCSRHGWETETDPRLPGCPAATRQSPNPTTS